MSVVLYEGVGTTPRNLDEGARRSVPGDCPRSGWSARLAELTGFRVCIVGMTPPENGNSSSDLGCSAIGIRQSKPEKGSRAFETGREIFTRRQGQLNLACVQRHDDNWGQKLAGIVMPQAHPTGYPLYRDLRLAPASGAQLPDRHARGAICLWLARICRAGELPDVACARDADGDAGREAVRLR
jgi:hypothetical protein